MCRNDLKVSLAALLPYRVSLELLYSCLPAAPAVKSVSCLPHLVSLWHGPSDLVGSQISHRGLAFILSTKHLNRAMATPYITTKTSYTMRPKTIICLSLLLGSTTGGKPRLLRNRKPRMTEPAGFPGRRTLRCSSIRPTTVRQALRWCRIWFKGKMAFTGCELRALGCFRGAGLHS